jgi:hypothetical protein
VSLYAVVIAFILLFPWVVVGVPFVGAAAAAVRRRLRKRSASTARPCRGITPLPAGGGAR